MSRIDLYPNLKSPPADAQIQTGTAVATDKFGGDVVVLSSALPSGSATLAEQQIQTTSLQLIDDVIATTGAAITTKGAAISGTDGTNARIIKTDAAGELQIDVLSSALPTGASTLAEQQTQTTSLQLIDDSIATVGAAVLTKGIQIQGSDGTNSRIIKTDAAGELQIDVLTSGLPTGASTLAEQQTQTTSLQLIDDIVATTGAAITTKGATAIGTDGTNARVLKTDTNGELQIDVLTSGLPTGAATLAEQQTQTTSLQLIDDVIATTGAAITTKGAAISGTDGTNARIIKTNTTGEVAVNVISSALPTGAATEATLAKLTQTQGSTTSGQSGPLVQGAVTTADPTYTTGATDPISLTTAGRLRVDSTGSVASAATDSGNPVKIGAVATTDTTIFTAGQRTNAQADTSGSIYVDNSGRIPTYSAASTFTAVASATDIFTLTGSASKTIKIRSIIISLTNTGNTNAAVYLVKRSTANSAGTSASVTIVPLDSNNATASGTVLQYTANPTLGTTVGTVSIKVIFAPSLASSNVDRWHELLPMGNGTVQPITLRGTSQVLAVNLNGVALGSTTAAYVSIVWTEEA